ncbi:MAG: Fpg/Nei family DNA glycosylase [Acidobacteriota bacterium]|nr:Fpg/Nei family DNA glycosylase [Acidobacteriota bacterium]
MPEGDTIFRAAHTLHRALADHIVTRFESMYPALTRVDQDAPIAGRVVTRVEARGKHLLMHFAAAPDGDDSRAAKAMVLRTHMRMHGSWHIYRHGERWQLPRRDARIVIETAAFVAVGFNVPVAEFLEEGREDRQDDLKRIGPDLLGERFDEDEAVRRLLARGAQPIAEALLNQRVVAGIGNVYKSEVLFLERVHPQTPASSVPEPAVRALLRTARRLLRANVADASAEIVTYRGLRRTTGRTDPEARLWVYGRGGKPCRRCAASIRYVKSGLDARGTYWCAACQPSGS